MSIVIETHALTKTYKLGNLKVKALRGIDLTVQKGEFIAVMGTSGSGKSTLMNLLGCLDTPTSGEYYLGGNHVNDLSRNDYADVRNRKIGFIFQGFNLLARTSALENVELPLLYDRSNRPINPMEAAMEALDKVGLADRTDHEPQQLSGGQQQRVAIARALVNQPAIILADEPTGNLDSRSSLDVLSVFQDLNESGITVIIVTHDIEIAQYCQRIVKIRDGLVEHDSPVINPRRAVDDLKNYKAENGD